MYVRFPDGTEWMRCGAFDRDLYAVMHDANGGIYVVDECSEYVSRDEVDAVLDEIKEEWMDG